MSVGSTEGANSKGDRQNALTDGRVLTVVGEVRLHLRRIER